MSRILTFLAALIVAVVLAGTASGATPSVVVSPNTGLSAGAEVSVSWSGSTAADTITVRQCVVVDGDIRCGTDDTGWVTVPASVAGTISLTLTDTVVADGTRHDCTTEGTCAAQMVGDLIRSGSTEFFDASETGTAGLNFAAAGYATGAGAETATAPPTLPAAADLGDGPGPETGSADPTGEAAVDRAPGGPLASTGYTAAPLALTAVALVTLGGILLVARRQD